MKTRTLAWILWTMYVVSMSTMFCVWVATAATETGFWRLFFIALAGLVAKNLHEFVVDLPPPWKIREPGP